MNYMITLKKAATTAAIFVSLFIAGMATVTIPEDPEEFNKAVPAILIGAAGAAIRAANNIYKNRELIGKKDA